VQERRLPRAGAADQRDRLALADLEVDTRERRHLGFSAAVDDGGSPAGDEGAHATTLPSRISSMRSAEAATAGECVTTTTVAPKSLRRRPTSSSTTASLR